MGMWEKWLIKGICKQALKENEDLTKAAKIIFGRIHKDLLPLRSDEKRIWRVHEYMFDIWRELTDEEFPIKNIEKYSQKIFEEKAKKIYG